MSARPRRRRALALLAVALACGALAAALVNARMRAAAGEQGPLVPVVVAARDLDAGAELAAADLRVERVPARYAPPDAPTAPGQAVGLEAAGPVVAGSPITAGVVGGGAVDAPGGLRRGERALELTVAGGAPLLEAAGPGTRVDVLVSSQPGDGPARTAVALEDVELLGLRPAAGGAELAGDPELEGPTSGAALATLRVTLRQAVYLTAAQAFAHELRLLPRPPGDRRHVAPPAVTAEDL